MSALLSSLASCDGGLSRHRRVAVSFGWPVEKRSTTTMLSPLPSILKDVSGFSLIRTLNAPSKVDGKPSTGMVLDSMGKKQNICRQQNWGPPWQFARDLAPPRERGGGRGERETVRKCIFYFIRVLTWERENERERERERHEYECLLSSAICPCQWG